jgi:hypothetical protein
MVPRSAPGAAPSTPMYRKSTLLVSAGAKRSSNAAYFVGGIGSPIRRTAVKANRSTAPASRMALDRPLRNALRLDPRRRRGSFPPGRAIGVGGTRVIRLRASPARRWPPRANVGAATGPCERRGSATPARRLARPGDQPSSGAPISRSRVTRLRRHGPTLARERPVREGRLLGRRIARLDADRFTTATQGWGRRGVENVPLPPGECGGAERGRRLN